MASAASVMKELQGLLRKAEVTFKGQVEVFLNDEENERREETDDLDDNLIFYFNVTPNDGLYKNAKCKFRAIIGAEYYPTNPPVVQCLTSIYHPNIDLPENTEDLESSNICVNLLGEDWQPEVGLDGCVMAVLFLFYHPQIDDALSCVCCSFESESEYEEKLYKALRGEEIDGNTFDRLIVEDEKEIESESENVMPEVVDKKEKIQTTVNQDGDVENIVSQMEVKDGEIGEGISSHKTESNDEENNEMNNNVTASFTPDKVCDNENHTTEVIPSHNDAPPTRSPGVNTGSDDPEVTGDVADRLPSSIHNDTENLGPSRVNAEANQEPLDDAGLLGNILTKESQVSESTTEAQSDDGSPMLHTQDSCDTSADASAQRGDRDDVLPEPIFKPKSRTIWYYVHRCLTKVKDRFSRTFCTLTQKNS